MSCVIIRLLITSFRAVHMLPQWQRRRLPRSSLNPAARNYCNELQPAESRCCVHTPKEARTPFGRCARKRRSCFDSTVRRCELCRVFYRSVVRPGAAPPTSVFVGHRQTRANRCFGSSFCMVIPYDYKCVKATRLIRGQSRRFQVAMP